MGEIHGHRKGKACLGIYGLRVAVQSPEMAAYFRFPKTSRSAFVGRAPVAKFVIIIQLPVTHQGHHIAQILLVCAHLKSSTL